MSVQVASRETDGRTRTDPPPSLVEGVSEPPSAGLSSGAPSSLLSSSSRTTHVPAWERPVSRTRPCGALPRPVTPLFGWTHWLVAEQIGTIVAMVLIVVVFALLWRRYPKHPILLMAICCTTLVWQDPIMNWAPYAVYNPQLWHWPETWPLVSLSPTVEPFVVIGYVMFYLAPFFPAIWILRRLQRSREVTSFVWKHPLVSLGLLIYVIGFIYDAAQEILLVRTGMYVYSQVIPFGSIFTGHAYQFPLIWESSLVTAVMIPVGVLLYRDDTGRTVAEKLALRIRLRAFRGRPALATFVVMFLIVNAAYLFLYGGGFRRHPGERGGHLGGVSVSVSRGEGLRPAGPLREGGSTRPILGGHLGRLGDGSVGPSCRAPSRAPRALQPVVRRPKVLRD